ncbi:uncharacterized protein G2W53_028853 [Senna tora]|uniref:Uncharacterized protein n=1 Tax=Senna tora TaxID=362788 RepID=A0A834T330_9FABA|nr:uncharacterized protein G2W53_028853 [Senna tora]
MFYEFQLRHSGIALNLFQGLIKVVKLRMSDWLSVADAVHARWCEEQLLFVERPK